MLAAIVLAGCRTSSPTPAASPSPAPQPAVVGELPVKHTPEPTTPAISQRDLMTRLYIYADDSMLGRRAGAIGNFKATAYIADEARRIGLEPAGDNGTYFQNIPLMRQGVDSSSTLSVEGGPPFTLWTDFIPLPEFEGAAFGGIVSLQGVTAIYGGRLGEPDKLISPLQAEGKLVILAPRMGPEGRPIAGIGDEANQRYGRAAAVAFATLDVTGASTLNFLKGFATGMTSGPSSKKTGSFIISNAAATRLMGAPLDGMKPGTIGKRVTANMRHAEMPTVAPARNVVAILRGSDPAFRNEYVAIGAHSDHIGTARVNVDHDSLKAFNIVLRREGAEAPPRPATPDDLARIRAMIDSLRAKHAPRIDSVYNGADDDGSGTTGVLEIAEALAAMRPAPKRSILFVWHTAEELGLFGSEYFTDHPTVPRDSIVAQLNIDMIGRGSAADSPEGGPGYVQVLGPKRLSSELAALVESVNVSGRHGLRLDYQFDADNHPLQYYCRSDHERYARYGIPIAFFSTGSHPDYHMLTDEPQYIDYNRLAQVADYVRDLAVTVANLDHRLVVDGSKPNPMAPCRQ